MKKRMASGYKNYGMIPVNEYTTTNAKKSTNSDDVSRQTTQASNVEYEPQLLYPKAKRRLGRLQCSGWLRSRSTNGWRAESASQQHETAHAEGRIHNTRRGKRPIG